MAGKRLLLVSDEMEVGGSQRQIQHLLQGIDRSAWDPELLFFRTPSFLIDEIRRLGIPVHHIPKRGRVDVGFVIRYAALLRRRNYALIHAFSMTAELWTLVARALMRHAPAQIASVRGLYLDEPAMFWRLKRLVIRHSAAAIANARACAAAAAARTGIPADHFTVIANGVLAPAPLEDGESHRIRESLDVPPARVLGLFVGRLVPEKNLPCLLRAMAALPADARPCMVLAGDGPLRDELQALAGDLDLAADVRFLGQRTDAGRLMQAADFLVLPSCQEGMSNAILEAMSVGCPVLASRVGGNPELLDPGQTGLLFPDDDHEALAVCLRMIASDPMLRRRLSVGARRTVRHRHSVSAMVDATTAVYEHVLRDPVPLRRAADAEQAAPMGGHP